MTSGDSLRPPVHPSRVPLKYTPEEYPRFEGSGTSIVGLGEVWVGRDFGSVSSCTNCRARNPRPKDLPVAVNGRHFRSVQ